MGQIRKDSLEENWEIHTVREGYVLERSPETGRCRILDHRGMQVAAGNEEEMCRRLDLFCVRLHTVIPVRGDVIGVHRHSGVYDHFGIYESDDCVYEYAGAPDISVRTTTLRDFIGDNGDFFLVAFPSDGIGHPEIREHGPGIPIESLSLLRRLLSLLTTSESYHLYTPEETIQRARSRLGEREYDLAFNNCEHFALWCKTGVSRSAQLDSVLNLLALGIQAGRGLRECLNHRPVSGTYATGQKDCGPGDRPSG